MVETFVQSTDDVVKIPEGPAQPDQGHVRRGVLGASDTKARETAFIELRQLLAVHETAEEMVVHPRVRHEATGGDEIVDARLEEEHEAKEMLSALEDMDIGSQEFIDELTVFRDAVHRPRRARGDRGVQQAGARTHAEDRGRMAKAVLAAEAIAPTRPHAGVERPRRTSWSARSPRCSTGRATRSLQRSASQPVCS